MKTGRARYNVEIKAFYGLAQLLARTRRPSFQQSAGNGRVNTTATTASATPIVLAERWQRTGQHDGNHGGQKR